MARALGPLSPLTATLHPLKRMRTTTPDQAGPSAHPDYPNCATSSERTPFWLFPGDVASHLFGEASFGHPQGAKAKVAAHA
jgi:hypothetical protein